MAKDSPGRRPNSAEDDDGSSPTEPGAADLQATLDESATRGEPSGFQATRTGGGDSGAPTQTIGPYRLIRELGKGGMGTVYLASRTDAAFHQQVALKVVTSGADRGEVISRFERERRILSSLEHPNIARLLDGGASDDGRPYIVMDYVEGLPLDEHCDRNKLSTTQRLELFRQVCGAVQYAHRNLIVHRDLKPKNVLVTSAGVPKLLDFGIAKLLNPELWGDVAQTATGFGPLTPAFASPEQVRGEPITTATDVYALGAMLYVLLTGRLPYRLDSGQPLELLKAVTEQEAERPSTVVGRAETIQLATGAVRKARDGTAQRLRVRLQGDLDTIMLAALRKEPERRYPSVEAFSEDIRRHLEGLPIHARKRTLAYRSSKFIRRNKAALAAAVAVFAALVGLTAFSISERVVADRERARAEQERDRAETEAAKSKAVVAFLQETLGSANPYEGVGRDVTVMEVLAGAVDAVEESFGDQPEIKAALQNTIGGTYRDLSRYSEAEPLIRSGLDIRRRALGDEHPDVAESKNDLALLLWATGDYAAAEPLYREALAIQRKQRDEGLAAAGVLNNLAVLLRHKGDPKAAEPLYREALAIRRELLGDEHPDVAQSLNNLAVLLADAGDYDDAEPLHREALAIQRKLRGDEHPDVAQNLNNLAVLLLRKGEPGAAEPLLREALAMRRKLFGDAHPDVATSLNNLGVWLRDEGNPEASEPLLREALAMRRKLLGGEHPLVAASLTNLAILLANKGDHDAAAPLWAEAVGVDVKAFGPSDWRTARDRGDHGACLTKLGRFEEAEKLLLAAHPVLRDALGEEHDRTRKAVRALFELYDAWNRPERAAEYQALLGDE